VVVEIPETGFEDNSLPRENFACMNLMEFSKIFVDKKMTREKRGPSGRDQF